MCPREALKENFPLQQPRSSHKPAARLSHGSRTPRGTNAQLSFVRRLDLHTRGEPTSAGNPQSIGSRPLAAGKTPTSPTPSRLDLTGTSTPRGRGSVAAHTPASSPLGRSIRSDVVSPLSSLRGKQAVSIFSASSLRDARSPQLAEDTLSRSVERLLYRNISLKEKIELLHTVQIDLELKNSRAAADGAFLNAVPFALPALRQRKQLVIEQIDNLQRKNAFFRAQIAAVEAKNASQATRARELRVKQTLVRVLRKEFEVVEADARRLSKQSRQLQERLTTISFDVNRRYEVKGRLRANDTLRQFLQGLRSQNPRVAALVHRLRELAGSTLSPASVE